MSPLGVYEGKWKHGKAEGEGTLTLRNNTIFRGFFHNNEFIEGVVTYPNFDEYSGKIKNGVRNDNRGKYIYRHLR